MATKYDLEKYIKFNSKIESATWDDERGVWEVDVVSNDGTLFEDTCEVLVNASGILRWMSQVSIIDWHLLIIC